MTRDYGLEKLVSVVLADAERAQIQRQKTARVNAFERRFWAKVAIADPDACWLWMGTKVASGYGRIEFGGKVMTATRACWIITRRELIPDGMLVCHTCDNPPCVNPAHLFVGTHLENAQDKMAKGRHQRPGSRNPVFQAETPVPQLPDFGSTGTRFPI